MKDKKNNDEDLHLYISQFVYLLNHAIKSGDSRFHFIEQEKKR